MSLLSKGSSGRQAKPMINVIMGIPKIGKTTFATAFPDCAILDLEARSYHVNVKKRWTPADLEEAKMNNLAGVKALIKELITEPHDYKTLVIDSAEALEDLLHLQICKTEGCDSIEKAGGGFMKGYVYAEEAGREFMKMLQELRDKRGMTINIVAHTTTKNFNDPATNATFTRYEMRVHHKLGAVIRDLADNQLFCTHKYDTFTDKTTKKQKAVGTGDRVIYTEWRPAFDAGNTYSLPFEIELSYEAFKQACEEARPKTAEELKAELSELVKHMDDEVRPKVVARIKEAKTAEELESIKAKVLTTIKPAA